MKDQYGKTVKIDDPVLVQPLDHTGILVGTIVGFNDDENCCHVECGGEIYKEIESEEITFWMTKKEEKERKIQRQKKAKKQSTRNSDKNR